MNSRILAPVVVLLAILTAGCSSDDEPEPTAPVTSSATSESSDSPSETDATDGTPSASDSTSAGAAGGEQVQLKNTVKFRVPDQYDWLIDDSGDQILATAVIDGGVLDISSGDVLFDDSTVDEAADITLDTWDDASPTAYRRTANRTVAGVEGFVIEGKGNTVSLLEFGTVHNGRLVTVDLNYPNTFDAAAATEVFEAVLASIEWK